MSPCPPPLPPKRSLATRAFRHKRRLACALVALALLCLAFLWPQPPAEHVPLGEQQTVETSQPLLCAHALLENEVEEGKIKSSLVLTRELGATSIVQFFPWPYYESRRGQFDWAGADRIIAHARRQGLSIFARLGLVPAWARPASPEAPTTLNTLPEAAFDDFARYAGAFARRYRGAVDAIIIWNEPNLSFEWGYRPVDPAAYVRLLRASYRHVKAANPDIEALAGALAPTLESDPGGAGLNDIDYLVGMYQAGAADHFDALAIHSYGFREPPSAEPAKDRLNFRRAELLRQVMIDHGDAAKPVYITEFGWNDHPRWAGAVRPSQRTAYTIEAYEYAAANWHWTRALCLWALRYPADLHSYPDNFTLISADFRKKPIYYALQEYARGWARSERLWLPPPESG